MKLWFGALLLATIACQSQSAPPSTSAPAGMGTIPKPPASGSTAASAELDRLDARARVPLLPMMANHQKQNMREHLVAVQQIVAAAAARDFRAVEEAARRIGYSEQMAGMCNHMGAAAPGFTERALAFHHSADKIGAAAQQRDLQTVLQALGETLSSCTGCHATFKQHVVSMLPAAAHEPLPAGAR